jgi:small conductance mechanosensitive channel
MHNYGTLRQLSLSVSVVYGTNIARAIEVVQSVLAANAHVLKDPAPAVGIANLKEVAIEIAIKPWTQVADSGAAGPAIYNELLEKFRAAGIQIYMPAVRVVAA